MYKEKWIDMRKFFIALILTFSVVNSAFTQGYISEYKSISASFGVSNYHATVLDNRANNSSFLSYTALMGYHIPLSALFNFNQQLGFGTLQNADTTEVFWTKANQFSYALGLTMNVPKFFARGYNKAIIPFALVNYQFNYFDKTSISRPKNLSTQFNVGGGVSWQINDNLGVYTQLVLGQRLGADFKTSINTQIGLQALIYK